MPAKLAQLFAVLDIHINLSGLFPPGLISSTGYCVCVCVCVCVWKPKLAWARGIGVLFERVVLYTHTHTNIHSFPLASKGGMGEGTLAIRMYMFH